MSVFTVKVKDFQSIKSAELDLVDGINIITGKTNAGKSALFRAVDCALFNRGDDSLVRSGKRFSEVELSNGKHSLVFKRDSKGKNEKTSYVLDGGSELKKVGRTQLPEVAKMFNIRDVRMANNVSVRINFWYQNDKPFLMDKTSGQLYEFMSLSSCDNYSRVLKKMGVDLKIQNAEIEGMHVRIDTIRTMTAKKEDFVSSNEGFDMVYERAISCEREDRRLESVKELINDSIRANERKAAVTIQQYTVDTIISAYPTGIENKVKEAEKEHRILDSLNSLLCEVETIKDSLSKAQQRKDSVNASLESLNGLAETENNILSAKSSTQQLAEIEETLKQAQTFVKQRITSRKALQGINGILEKCITLLQKVEASIMEYEKENRTLLEIQKAIEDGTYKKNSLHNSKKSLENCTTALQTAVEDIEGYKKEIGVCPLCGTTF